MLSLLFRREIRRHGTAERALTRAAEQLVELASTDPLTGVANRRRFDEALESEWSRAKRDGSPVSLLLLDIDRFKAYNDHYGHQQGDVCLRAVASAVRNAVFRPGDVVARFGGEEFVIVLPGVDQAGAAVVAERVRAVVEVLAISHAANSGCGSVVTVSLGCATLTPAIDEVEPSAIVAAADRHLYEAKRMGRNRAVSALPTSTSVAMPFADDGARRSIVMSTCELASHAEPSVRLDVIAAVTAQLFRVPMAFVSVVGEEELVVIGRHNIATERAPRQATYCAHTLEGDEPLVVPDTRADPRFAKNPFTQAGMGFYAGTPLVSSSNGQKVGTLCILDHKARPGLDAIERRLLTELARLTMDYLEDLPGAAGNDAPEHAAAA